MKGISMISAFGADKAFIPSGFEEVVPAGFFVRELLVKLQYIHGNPGRGFVRGVLFRVLDSFWRFAHLIHYQTSPSIILLSHKGYSPYNIINPL